MTGVVASYERISKFRVQRGDVDTEVQRGVDRQHTDATKAADYLGLGTVTRYTDDGFSASEFRTKEREAWEELLEAVRAGGVSHVLFWLFDRAFRTTDDAGRFLTACRAGGTLIVQTGGWSPIVVNASDPDDVYRMKQAALQAEYEVAKMSMRQRRHKAAMAEAGKSHGGKRRFGYTTSMDVMDGTDPAHPVDEAGIVRELVSRLLAGDSLYVLAKWLTDTGVAPTSGGKWTGPNLRHMLMRPHLAGLRVHHGKVIGPGAWEALIPEETHHQVVTYLTNPDRRTNRGGNARKWLLSGLMLCAAEGCGETCRARPPSKRSVAAYACKTGKHVHRPAEHVERVVTDAVVAYLTRLTKDGLLVDDDAHAEVIRLQAARDAVADRKRAYAALASTMDPEAYAAATNQLTADLAELDLRVQAARLDEGHAARVLDGATGPGAGEAWKGFTLDRQRAIIREVATVSLIGGGRGGPHDRAFDPRCVVVDFR